MGAAVLSRRPAAALAVAAVLWLVPGGDLAAQTERPLADDGVHAGLACATCHRLPVAGRDVGGVPEAACTGSGCHEDGGPDRVTVSTVTFEHRGHGDTASVSLGCAGCHGHASGGEPIEPTVATCALCHAEQIEADRAEACRTCHQQPRHVPRTSQGVSVPHADLPWLVEGCTRCHYDVERPRTGVSVARCRDCHDDVGRATSRGIGTDLHPRHRAVGCLSCHDRGLHRVEAMSTSVELACASCHAEPHGTEGMDGRREVSAMCTTCHRDTHAGQQRMVLGLVFDMPVTPAYKFDAGLTCESCHTEDVSSAAIPSSVARACRGCHRSEYTRVLTWWEEGADQRLQSVRSYESRARRALAGASSDSVAGLLERADALAAFVDSAGVAHNVMLADGALREAVERVRSAYAAAGRQAPTPPDLGRRPRVGFCSYCHYRIGEPTTFDEIPEDFHREVTRRLQQRRGSGGL